MIPLKAHVSSNSSKARNIFLLTSRQIYHPIPYSIIQMLKIGPKVARQLFAPNNPCDKSLQNFNK